MKNIKYFIIFSIVTGCLQSGVERVRIVDEQGNPAKINKMVPKFNEEQLVKQREAFNNNQETTGEVNKFRQDYNSMHSINKDQSPATSFSDQNIIIPVNEKIPNDIFADRITNYNYIKDSRSTSYDYKKNTSSKVNTRREVIDDINNQIIEGDIIDNKTGEKIDKNKIYKQQPTEQEYQEKTTNPIKYNKTTNAVKPNKTVSAPIKTSNQTEYYIQIGVYSEKKNANTAYNKYSKISIGSIEEINVKDKKKYKVLLGPYTNKKTAEQNLEKVIKTGHYDVYITKKK